MNEYQIGQDVQLLKMRLEKLEKRHLSKDGALKENELSELQARNLKRLKRHSNEIAAEIDKLLSARGIELHLAAYTLVSNKDEAGEMLNASGGPCCCDCGWYVSNCEDCCIIHV